MREQLQIQQKFAEQDSEGWQKAKQPKTGKKKKKKRGTFKAENRVTLKHTHFLVDLRKGAGVSSFILFPKLLP